MVASSTQCRASARRLSCRGRCCSSTGSPAAARGSGAPASAMPKSSGTVVDERRLGQRHAAGAEVRRHLEQQPVAADRHAPRRRAAAPSARPSSLSAQAASASSVPSPSRRCSVTAHAGGRAAVGGVEHVGAEVSHRVVSGGSPDGAGLACTAAKCIHFGIHVNPTRAPSTLLTAIRADLEASRPAPAGSRAAAPGARAGRRRRRHGSTQRIVDSITTAIVERRLMPGTKLAEQQIADIFKVSRTLVRQALNQLSRDRLVTLEPARGAFVAQPSVEEARQVFEVRKMLEAAMVRQLCATSPTPQVAELRAHLQAEPDGGGAHRRPRPHAAAGRLPRRAGAPARQRGAGPAAGGPAVALLADRADVPVVAFGRTFAGRTRGHRRRARAARRARRGAADGISTWATSNATCGWTRACPTWPRCCNPAEPA